MMKPGVPFRPNPPLFDCSELLQFSECYHIPVVHDPHLAGFAQAFGVWPKKHIRVGDPWFGLPTPRERRAVLLHELGHCRRLHIEARALAVLVCLLPAAVLLPWTHTLAIVLTVAAWFGVEEVAKAQEYAADRFAAEKGYGVECVQFLARFGPENKYSERNYPDRGERITRLQKFLRGSLHAAP